MHEYTLAKGKHGRMLPTEQITVPARAVEAGELCRV